MTQRFNMQICPCGSLFFMVMLESDDAGRQKEAELTCVECKGRKSFELKVEE